MKYKSFDELMKKLYPNLYKKRERVLLRQMTPEEYGRYLADRSIKIILKGVKDGT